MKRVSLGLAAAFLALSAFALGHEPVGAPGAPATAPAVRKIKLLSTDLRDGCGPARHTLRPRKSGALTVARR